MLSIYQKQKHESFSLWMGLTYQLLHTMFGADMGGRFHNISSLLLLSLEYFSTLDGRAPEHVFVGNCLVSMISPDQYVACNYEYDHRTNYSL